jgi:hypothetical protein
MYKLDKSQLIDAKYLSKQLSLKDLTSRYRASKRETGRSTATLILGKAVEFKKQEFGIGGTYHKRAKKYVGGFNSGAKYRKIFGI